MYLLQSVLLLLVAGVSADNLITYKIPITTEIKIALGYPEACYLNFTELSTKHGYNSEEHNVTTEDGYILTIFRMTSPNCTQLRTPVLLMHGAVLNSDEFLKPGVDAGWAFLLANSCYDVWVGNNRGNSYGRAHQTLDPDKDAKFWDFSIDEFGIYDTPAMIDYVLSVTASEKVNLIGYSLGGLNILAMLADLPDYNSKVNVNVVLASSHVIYNMKSILFKYSFLAFYYLGDFLRSLGIQEVLFKQSVEQTLLEYTCQHESLNAVCTFIIGLSDNFHPGSIAGSTVQTMFNSLLTGTSSKVVTQGGQYIVKKGFYKYDYGSVGNLARYGTESSPAYNISAVVAPTLILHGLGDNIIVTEDVQQLASKLPNLLEFYIASDPLWNHADCGWSKDVPDTLYGKVDQYFNQTTTTTT